MDVDGASHTLSATTVLFSDVRNCFWFFTLWFNDEDCQFLSLFSQDNEHTQLTVIFAHILQHYHDFQSNVTIFPSIVQTYTQPSSFDERIKLIICQIRHELSVTIHDIKTS